MINIAENVLRPIIFYITVALIVIGVTYSYFIAKWFNSKTEKECKWIVFGIGIAISLFIGILGTLVYHLTLFLILKFKK